MSLDFPNSPTDGQVYDNFYYDADKEVWKSLSAGASPSILVNPTIENATINNSMIEATAETSSSIPLIVNGTASQTANLQEWKNSAGIILSSVNSQGRVSTPDLTVTRSDSSFEGGQINLARALDNASHWSIDSYGNGLTPDLRVANAGGVVMTINNSGHFSVPGQPAFSIRGTGTQAWSGAQVITKVSLGEGATFLNNGNHYSAANSRFTAPTPGIYLFNGSFAVTTSIGGPEFFFYKNGSSFFSEAAIGYGAAYNTFGNIVIMELAANDYVEVFMRNNNATSFTIDRNRSSFSGIKIA
jgi:hypothetical protein